MTKCSKNCEKLKNDAPFRGKSILQFNHEKNPAHPRAEKNCPPPQKSNGPSLTLLDSSTNS